MTLIITLQRDKCIGCNYCAEIDPEHFHMSKKDGKSHLKKSISKKGFHTFKTTNPHEYELAQSASEACPVKIIQLSNTK